MLFGSSSYQDNQQLFFSSERRINAIVGCSTGTQANFLPAIKKHVYLIFAVVVLSYFCSQNRLGIGCRAEKQYVLEGLQQFTSYSSSFLVFLLLFTFSSVHFPMHRMMINFLFVLNKLLQQFNCSNKFKMQKLHSFHSLSSQMLSLVLFFKIDIEPFLLCQQHNLP